MQIFALSAKEEMEKYSSLVSWRVCEIERETKQQQIGAFFSLYFLGSSANVRICTIGYFHKTFLFIRVIHLLLLLSLFLVFLFLSLSLAFPISKSDTYCWSAHSTEGKKKTNSRVTLQDEQCKKCLETIFVTLFLFESRFFKQKYSLK